MKLRFTTRSGRHWDFDNVTHLTQLGGHTYEILQSAMGILAGPVKTRIVDVANVQFNSPTPNCPRCHTAETVIDGPDSWICTGCGAHFIPQ